MTLKLYNTLTRRKEAFEPLDAANVRMYVCGPTVYDDAHIGNARPVIVFDLLYRLLRHLYGADHVTYVRNITDVDDKIIARAAEEGVAIDDLTARTARQFHDDVKALGCLPPTVEPRATDHIPQMIAMIARLIETGHAYEAQGHVLFHVPSMPDYGKLARRSLDDMQAGARVEVAPYKRDPMDFVLWKPAKQEARSAVGATGTRQEARSAEGATGSIQEARSAEGATGTIQPHEPGWESPWGRGRPGWHIECSAMAAAHLGEVFDIHGGGVDLVFPHHENEIAQSRCAHGTEIMARYWLHNGFLQVEGEKMSKSLGNFFTIRDLLAEWPGEVIRLAMLMTQYRQPLNWTRDMMREAWRALDHWYELTAEAAEAEPPAEVLGQLEDDLSTPRALAALHELRSLAAHGDKKAAASLKAGARLMGLLELSIEDWRAWRPDELAVDEGAIQRLVAARTEARRAKDFAEADRIRDELAEMGIALKDGPEGTSWEVAR